ncbi:phosphoadenosine phosphosulfate reductase family protein [Shigella flexneri]
MSLHLVHQIAAYSVIPHRYGYLFPETYRFIDELTNNSSSTEKCTVLPKAQPGRKHATENCEQGVEGIEKYNDINKVEPMNRALKALTRKPGFAGLRREQSGSRANLPAPGNSAWRI